MVRSDAVETMAAQFVDGFDLHGWTCEETLDRWGGGWRVSDDEVSAAMRQVAEIVPPWND